VTQPVYRSLRGWKYELMRPFTLALPPALAVPFDSEYVSIRDGWLVLERGYAWDGASGPTFDTQVTMRGALVHDGLYQAIRLGCPIAKSDVDTLFHDLLREDGMSKFRAWYWYHAVKWFGHPKER
jgi:hypothetical protein